LADEELANQLVPVEEEGLDVGGEEEETLSPPRCNRADYEDGDPCSSPVAEDDFEGANGYEGHNWRARFIQL